MAVVVVVMTVSTGFIIAGLQDDAPFKEVVITVGATLQEHPNHLCLVVPTPHQIDVYDP